MTFISVCNLFIYMYLFKQYCNNYRARHCTRIQTEGRVSGIIGSMPLMGTNWLKIALNPEYSCLWFVLQVRGCERLFVPYPIPSLIGWPGDEGVSATGLVQSDDPKVITICQIYSKTDRHFQSPAIQIKLHTTQQNRKYSNFVWLSDFNPKQNLNEAALKVSVAAISERIQLKIQSHTCIYSYTVNKS